MLIESVIEKTINQYLSFDPEIRSRLKNISGRIIRINITTLNFIIYLKIKDEKFLVSSKIIEPIDASLKGTLSAFTQTGIQSWQQQSAMPKDLEITGDPRLIQTINEIFQQVEIDWEELVSDFTGDIIAHQLGDMARGLKKWMLQATNTVTKNFTEYVQEEVMFLPPRMAIEDFCDDVDRLRDDVERAEARLNKGLSNHHAHNIK